MKYFYLKMLIFRILYKSRTFALLKQLLGYGMIKGSMLPHYQSALILTMIQRYGDSTYISKFVESLKIM